MSFARLRVLLCVWRCFFVLWWGSLRLTKRRIFIFLYSSETLPKIWFILFRELNIRKIFQFIRYYFIRLTNVFRINSSQRIVLHVVFESSGIGIIRIIFLIFQALMIWNKNNFDLLSLLINRNTWIPFYCFNSTVA